MIPTDLPNPNDTMEREYFNQFVGDSEILIPDEKSNARLKANDLAIYVNAQLELGISQAEIARKVNRSSARIHQIADRITRAKRHPRRIGWDDDRGFGNYGNR